MGKNHGEALALVLHVAKFFAPEGKHFALDNLAVFV